MAKKAFKTDNKTAPQTKAPKKQKKEKVFKKKVKVNKPLDQEKISKIVSAVFITVGIALIGIGIFSYINYRQTPELDNTLEIPSMVGISKLTNGDKVILKGVANDFDEVFVYIDGEKIGTAKVAKDSTFEYVHMVDAEGTYSVAVAGVRGFPRRFMSEVSLSDDVVVDWTAPEVYSLDYSSEVGTEYFTVIGTSDANAEVSLKRGVDSYSAISDAQGSFKITQVMLEEGANVFNVEVEDLAGNMNKVDDKVRVTYSPESDVNGDAVYDVTTEDGLPVAAGELEDAIEYIFGNNLMVIFGILALVGFGLSSTVMYKKYKA